MLLFAGLGNPGRDYAGNRHNAGFMALDLLVDRHGFSLWKAKDGAQIAEGRIGSHKILAIKPQSFMNKSGLPVAEAARFYKIPPTNIFVFYDEIDLAAGKIRVKRGGGHGGHNGIRDIDRHQMNAFRCSLSTRLHQLALDRCQPVCSPTTSMDNMASSCPVAQQGKPEP